MVERSRVAKVLLTTLLLVASACGGNSEVSSHDRVEDPPSAVTSDPLAPQPLDQATPITIAMNSKLEAYAPVLLADHFGEFEKENLEVELEFMPPAESALLVAQGKIDMASGAFTAGTFNLVAQGSRYRFVFPGVGQPADSTQGFWANKDAVGGPADALTADAFLDKKILTPSGDSSTWAVALFNYLQTLPGGDELDPSALIFEPFDPASAAEALKSEAAAVAQIASPFNLGLEDDSCCEFIAGASPTETTNAYAFGPSLEGRADVGAAIVRSLARTTQAYLPTGYRRNTATMAGLAEVLDLDVETLRGLPPLSWDPAFKSNVEDNLKGQAFFRDRGLLQYADDLSADDIYDMRFLEAIGVVDP